MASECLGLALVIANDYKDNAASTGRTHLPGTLADSNDYNETFVEYLKYKVVVRCNLKGNGIRRAIDDLISEARDCPFGREEACIAFVFCGHGDEGVIVGQDGVKVRLEEIFNRFQSSAENRHLARLVKLFFIDACRGVNEDRGVLTPRGGEIALEKLVPSEGNMLIAYSTLPQYQAYELKFKGNPRGLFSCFLNQELRKDANIEESLENIITIVTTRMVEESKKYSKENVKFQIPQKVATLRRMLKPLKEAREFLPRPVPAPRRSKATPIQCGVPSLPGGELSPSTLHHPGAVSGGEGVLTAAGQVSQQQILSAGSMHVTQQLQPMSHQSHISGSPVTASLASPHAAPHSIAATPTSYTSSATPTLRVDGPMATVYMPGATHVSYVYGATPTSYTGATPTPYPSGGMPSPLRPTSTPSVPHYQTHCTAREAARLIAERAGETLKRNFTEEPSVLGLRYCCEVEFVHCGRPCKGKSRYHTSKDIAEEEACQDLLNQNPAFLQSLAFAPMTGASFVTHNREQSWMEPALSHLGSSPLGGAALQTISVRARSGTTPTSLPHDYQESPQYAYPSTSQSGPLPPHTNYQGIPQSTGTPPTNISYQGQPQLGKNPKTQLKELCEQNYWASPRYNTSPTNGFRSTVLVHGLGVVTGSEQPNKKKAEQDAAEKALLKLKLQNPPM